VRKIQLGFSTGSLRYSGMSLKEKVRLILTIQNDCIELNLRPGELENELLDQEFFDLLAQFKHRFIHGFRVEKLTTDIFRNVLELTRKVEISSVLFHPDWVEDFDWYNKVFGEKLSYENMDTTKQFGNTVQDMQEVFDNAPQAGWVFDVNHLYTVDPSMSIALEYYSALGERLQYYHLSGVGVNHDFLYRSQEDIIVRALYNLDKPIIIEGPDIDKVEIAVNRECFRREYEYIMNLLV
jgi:hypothetical protein